MRSAVSGVRHPASVHAKVPGSTTTRVVVVVVVAQAAGVGVDEESPVATPAVDRDAAVHDEPVLVAGRRSRHHIQPRVGRPEPSLVEPQRLAGYLPAVEAAGDVHLRGGGVVEAEQHAAVGQLGGAESGQTTGVGDVGAGREAPDGGDGGQEVGRRLLLGVGGPHGVHEGPVGSAPQLVGIDPVAHHRRHVAAVEPRALPGTEGARALLEREPELGPAHVGLEDGPEVVDRRGRHVLHQRRSGVEDPEVGTYELPAVVVMDGQREAHRASLVGGGRNPGQLLERRSRRNVGPGAEAPRPVPPRWWPGGGAARAAGSPRPGPWPTCGWPRTRPEEPGHPPQQRLGGLDPPVVGDDHLWALLLECPPARALQVTYRRDRKASLGDRLVEADVPRQGVRQPALGVELAHAPDPVGATVLQPADGKVDRWPPLRQGVHVAEDVGHLRGGARHPPDSEEAVLAGHPANLLRLHSGGPATTTSTSSTTRRVLET